MPSFSSLDQGTPEESWLAALAELVPVPMPLTTGRLVVVAPHPDDETLGAGGLMTTLSGRGWSVTVVTVTDGEAAYPEVEELVVERACEVQDSLAALGVAASVVRLGIPDGAVNTQLTALRSSLRDLFVGADLIVGPWEGDGHPDHEAVGSAVSIEAGTIPLWRYPVWAWHWSGPHAEWFTSARRLDLEPDVVLAKRRALAQFSSQISHRHGEPILPPWVLEHFCRDSECFVVGSMT